MGERLAAIYDELGPIVTGYFRARGARDPDDSCGDVFVKVATGLAGFRGDDRALRRWVFTIAHNQMVDEYRSAARRREQPSAEVPDAARDEPRMDADDGAVDPALLGALSELTGEQREVVVLRYVADLSVRDVAKIVGKRQGAVKMLQSRALAELRSRLAAPG